MPKKYCFEFDCRRFDTDDPECEFCENNIFPEFDHSTPIPTISEIDCRDVGTLTDIWY